jgi:diguanylate cyclase (GGDEF)-like protein
MIIRNKIMTLRESSAMHGHLQRFVLERPAMCAANAEIAVQLSAAAIDGDHPRVKQLLADLLRCRTRGTDEDLSPLLQPLEDLFLLLHSMALTDELTGLLNRRGFLRSGARLLELAACKLHGALLIYIDVDNLKNVNDSSGHEVGDDLLRRAAQVLRDASGNHAVIGRLGGDEFAILDESTNYRRSHHMLRQIQNAVEACNASAAVPLLSLSIGCVEFYPQKPVSIMTLLAQADRAMYLAKARPVRRPECTAPAGP